MGRTKLGGIQCPERKALGVSGLECSPRAHPLHLARRKRHLFLPKLKRHLLGNPPPKSYPHSLLLQPPSCNHCVTEKGSFGLAPLLPPETDHLLAPGSCPAQVGAQ